MNLVDCLRQVVDDPALHGRWLNTISYLEYIGFRKIVKSQSASQVSSEVLRHVLEEGRHALLVKSAAVRMGGADLDVYKQETMLAADAAEEYLQEIDRRCAGELANIETRSKLNYLYVTWLIERRALEVYETYKSVLAEAGHEFPFAKILTEEDKHLHDVYSELVNSDSAFQARSQRLMQNEQRFYHNYLAALSSHLMEAQVRERAL